MLTIHSIAGTRVARSARTRVARRAVSASLGARARACWEDDDPARTGLGLPAPGGGVAMPAAASPSAGGASVAAGTLPCDVLEGAGLPCVSAHSTVRVVVRDYGGPLYRVE